MNLGHKTAFPTYLAKIVGVEKSLILGLLALKIESALSHNGQVYKENDTYYVEFSQHYLIRRFPFFPVSSVRRWLGELHKDGWINELPAKSSIRGLGPKMIAWLSSDVPETLVLEIETDNEIRMVQNEPKEAQIEIQKNQNEPKEAQIEPLINTKSNTKNKKKGEIKKEPPKDFRELFPDNLRTRPFEDKWAEWLGYRKSKKKPVSELAAKKQLKSLGDAGELAAIAAIDKAIESDWQSVYPRPLEAKQIETTNFKEKW